MIVVRRATALGVRLATAAAALAIIVAAPGCKTSKAKSGAAASGAPAIAPSSITTIGVNAYLWRASLDTLSFMPMLQVDSNGGVIVTDWYINPQSPNERVKVSVNILDTDLRADALRVNVNRQELGAAGWVEASVRAGTVQKLEDTILERARRMRQSQLPS
ncbi:MAG: DUF3576 domain-containing protein [Polymorphobacter sp.]